MRVLGFMSGTSLDGVDAAIIDTDGETIDRFGPALLLPFDDRERAVLGIATQDAIRWNGEGARPATFAMAEALILDVHLRAARLLLDRHEGAIDLVGFHGQTVLHRPERGLTVQLGDAAALADRLGIPVVADLRQADLAAGGQGAPLVPAYHAALADRIGAERPIAFLNIGGVANLSWLGRDGALVAFDTGPGNGLIDLLVQSRAAGRYDDGGRIAAAGRVDAAALQRLLASGYFAQTGPKSLDRYDFPLDAVEHLSLPDAAATLTEFTARAVALGAERLPERPSRWLVCGGGRHNPTLMRALRSVLGECESTDAHDLRGDFIEAEAMAFLAARSVRGLPLTYPGTTGVPGPTTGGRLVRPAGPRPHPEA
jgi:anhydro-N-acetylmuramic acid kinase